MHNLTGTFFALAMANAVIAGCSTQQASTQQASMAAPVAPIEFRVVPERNPAGAAGGICDKGGAAANKASG